MGEGMILHISDRTEEVEEDKEQEIDQEGQLWTSDVFILKVQSEIEKGS